MKKKSNHPLLVCSLTSYPRRINTVHIAINNMLEQTINFDKVILVLSTSEFPNKKLPSTITNIKDKRFEILWIKENYKAANKLYPTMLKYPDAYIATTDDDIYFDKDYVLKCAKRTAFFKKKNVVLCSYPWNSLATGSDDYKPRDLKETFLHGCVVPIYPPKCFDTNLIKKHLDRLMCQDDILFTIALKKEYKVLIFLKTWDQFVKYSGYNQIPNTQESGLWNTVNSPKVENNGNLRALNYCIQNRLLTLTNKKIQKFYKLNKVLPDFNNHYLFIFAGGLGDQCNNLWFFYKMYEKMKWDYCYILYINPELFSKGKYLRRKHEEFMLGKYTLDSIPYKIITESKTKEIIELYRKTKLYSLRHSAAFRNLPLHTGEINNLLKCPPPYMFDVVKQNENRHFTFYYDEECANIFQKLLVLKNGKFSSKQESVLELISNSKLPICFHIRCNDVINNVDVDVYGANPNSKYLDMFSKLKKTYKKATFFIFSNNYEIARKLLGISKNIVYTDSCNVLEPHIETYIMSKCKIFVGWSNSSFWQLAYCLCKYDKKKNYAIK